MSSRQTPHYLVLNRFDDEFGEYHRFVEPGSCRMVYLTLAHGLSVLDLTNALETVVVDDLDFDTVLPAAHELVTRHGPFDGIIGLSEFDLDCAARLRAALGVRGWTPEFVRSFRDKPRMKELINRTGLRVPRFLELDGTVSAEDIVAMVGLPVILKPRAGAASQGVVRATSVRQLAESLAKVDPAEFECEEYIKGDIYHVDGIRRGGEFHFVSASLYVNTCLDFALGQPLGSVLLDHGPGRARVIDFGAACLDALDLDDGPFHLELFGLPSGELVFLEIGLRPGGAEVPFLHRDLFGIDLFGEAFRATLGMSPLTPAAEFTEARGGGWVIVPEPRPLPSRIVQRTSLCDVLPGVYAEVIPDVGEVFDGSGGYGHVGGRFRLSGEDQASVWSTAVEVMTRYELIAEPVGLSQATSASAMSQHTRVAKT